MNHDEIKKRPMKRHDHFWYFEWALIFLAIAVVFDAISKTIKILNGV